MDHVSVRQRDDVFAKAASDGRTLGRLGHAIHRVNPCRNRPCVILELSGRIHCALERHELPCRPFRFDFPRRTDHNVAFAYDRGTVVQPKFAVRCIDGDVELLLLKVAEQLESLVDFAPERIARDVHRRQLTPNQGYVHRRGLLFPNDVVEVSIEPRPVILRESERDEGEGDHDESQPCRRSWQPAPKEP